MGVTAAQRGWGRLIVGSGGRDTPTQELAEGTEDFIRENEELQAALATQKTIIQSLCV